MSYKNAIDILPPQLLKEVQKHIDGGLIYIPKSSDRIGWGQLTGTRKIIQNRNEEIIQLFKKGVSIMDISNKYYLSQETIRKIVYSRK